MDPSSTDDNPENEQGLYDRPSKSEAKRECDHLFDLGEELMKLKAEEIRSLEISDELEDAIISAKRTQARGALKRQRRYIGKLLRSLDTEAIEQRFTEIQHLHDTNTERFKRLEQWRDHLIDKDKEVLNEIISRHPEIDRQHINQLIRTAQQEKARALAPAASRKLFRYLRELEGD